MKFATAREALQLHGRCHRSLRPDESKFSVSRCEGLLFIYSSIDVTAFFFPPAGYVILSVMWPGQCCWGRPKGNHGPLAPAPSVCLVAERRVKPQT